MDAHEVEEIIRARLQVRAIGDQIAALSLPQQLEIVGDILAGLREKHYYPQIQDMVATMQDIVGYEIRTPSRYAKYVRARTVVAYVAAQYGMTQEEIGDALLLDRCNISYLVAKMRDILDAPHPEMYDDYIDLYQRFISRLLNTTQTR